MTKSVLAAICEMKMVPPTEFARLRLSAQMTVAEAALRFGVALKTAYRWDAGEIIPKPAVLRELHRLTSGSQHPTSRAPHKFRFIDLFAGIGGLRRAFEAAGGRCVFTSEWDIACQQTYRANFPGDDHQIAGDIRDVKSTDLPAFDMLVAGFPCQPFSIAGVSKKNALGRPHGFRDDTQGTLFFEVARLIEERQPAAFLLENVKNLVNHDKGHTFEVIRRTLEDELNYTISYRVIDSRGWAPQHRERIFIAGFRRDVGCSLADLEVPPANAGPRLGSVFHSEDGSEEPEHPYTIGPLSEVSPKYALSDHLWRYLQDYAAKHKAKGNGFGFGLVGEGDVARTLSARYYKDGSEILVKRGRRNPRRLTPRECARLMGFDRPGESTFAIPVSDTQAYKQFGNSVVVPVATAVAQHMAPALLRLMDRNSSLEPELPLIPQQRVAAE